MHAKVIDFVQCSPAVFDDPAANPRTWQYVSQFLVEWEKGDKEQDLLAAALVGLLGDKWALAFLRFYADQRRPLQPAEIIDAYPAYRAALRGWVAQRHLDVVAASVESLKRHIQPQRVYESIVATECHKANVQDFFADLPPDLQRQIREWLDERGFRNLAVPLRRRGTKP